MHLSADPVTGESANDGVPSAFDTALNRRGDVSDAICRRDAFDPFEESVFRRLHEIELLFGNLADREGTRAVSVESVDVSA